MPREKITTEHSPESWNREVEKYAGGESFDAYARYMYPELEQREKEFAEMIGVPDTAIFNSGMAAIATTIEAEDLKPGDVILAGRDVYSETKKIYDSLEKNGVKIVKIDSGNMEEIEGKIKSEKPRLIILETVANDAGNPQMQVCDIKKLTELAKETNDEYKESFTPKKILEKYFSKREIFKDLLVETEDELLKEIEEFEKGGNPFIFRKTIKELEKISGLDRRGAIREISRLIKHVTGNSREKLSLIIDNTLPSPSLYNPIKDVGESDVEMVVVESGTKHFQEGQDKITMGVAYSSDVGKVKTIKDKRMALGTYLQPISEKEIPENITEVMPAIMKRHASNALELAKLLGQSGIEVNHPNLPEHAQSDLVQEIAPDGLVTLFYIKVPNAAEFVKKVYEAGGGRISVGGSFGHKKTWLFNLGDETVRIAAGQESGEEFEEILRAFEKAAQMTKI